MTITSNTIFTIELNPYNTHSARVVSLQSGKDIAIHKKDGSIIFGTLLDAGYNDFYELDAIVIGHEETESTDDDGFTNVIKVDKIVAISDIEEITDKVEGVVSAHLLQMMDVVSRHMIDVGRGDYELEVKKTLDLARLLCDGNYEKAWRRLEALLDNRKLVVNITGNSCEVTYKD